MPQPAPTVSLRDSADTDVPAITAIYAGNVLGGTGTFETEPPDEADMARRRADVLAKGLPWLVACEGSGADERVLGYAYATHFRPRLAYRFCVEDSVYLAGDVKGRGIGRLLLDALIIRCRLAGARQMVAVIGDANNAGSVGVHRAAGFAPIGVMRSAGWKFDRWLDVVLMQLELGEGDRTPPTGPAT